MSKLLETCWSNGRVGLSATVILAVGAGLISAWLTPRGPITTTQVLVSMGVALVVGVIAGAVLGNRWSLLVAPVVFVARRPRHRA